MERKRRENVARGKKEEAVKIGRAIRIIGYLDLVHKEKRVVFQTVERQRERTVASSLISTIAPTREGIPARTGIPVKLWPRL